jgi:hypothetical protein
MYNDYCENLIVGGSVFELLSSHGSTAKQLLFPKFTLKEVARLFILVSRHIYKETEHSL